MKWCKRKSSTTLPEVNVTVNSLSIQLPTRAQDIVAIGSAPNANNYNAQFTPPPPSQTTYQSHDDGGSPQKNHPIENGQKSLGTRSRLLDKTGKCEGSNIKVRSKHIVVSLIPEGFDAFAFSSAASSLALHEKHQYWRPTLAQFASPQLPSAPFSGLTKKIQRWPVYSRQCNQMELQR